MGDDEEREGPERRKPGPSDISLGDPERRRGRPELPPEERRSEQVTLSFRPSEFRALLHAAADDPGGPKNVRDWGRLVLLRAAGVEE